MISVKVFSKPKSTSGTSTVRYSGSSSSNTSHLLSKVEAATIYLNQNDAEKNFVKTDWFSKLFALKVRTTTTVTTPAAEGEEPVVSVNETETDVSPNTWPKVGTATETNDETHVTTTVKTEIIGIESKYGLFTDYFLASLGIGSMGSGSGGSGGSGGNLLLFEPLDTINEAGLNLPTATGQTLVWDTALNNGAGGFKWAVPTGSGVAGIDWAALAAETEDLTAQQIHASHIDAALKGYASIANGVITIGGNTYQTHTHGNLSVLDGITAAKVTAWDNVAAIMDSPDSDTIVNKWQEVVHFLDTYTEADTLANLLSNKVDKVTGKGLSTNDLTNELLTSLQDKYTKNEVDTKLNGYYTKEQADNEFVKVSFFNSLFQAYNGNTPVGTNTANPVIDNLKILVGTWTDNYLASLGISSANSGSSVVSLSDLSDVADNLTLTTGYVLKYNGTQWVAAAESGGIDTQQLATYLTQNGYLTQTNADGRYLPLTAGQAKPLTGTLYANLGIEAKRDTYQPLIIDSTKTEANVSKWTGIQFRHTIDGTSTIYGGIRMDEQNGSLFRYTSNFTTYKLLDEQNFESIIGQRYMTYDAFETLFEPQKKSGSTDTTLRPYNSHAGSIENIKAKFGLWTQEYLASLGIGSDNTAVAGIDWSALENWSASDPHTININYLPSIPWSKITGAPTHNDYVHPTNGANTTIASTENKFLNAITVNNLGHVTSVAARALTADDIPELAAGKITSGTFDAGRIPNLSWNKITTDRPNTLQGYGITDAVKSNTTWWGQGIQSGTPDKVEGSMTGVGDITMSGALKMQRNGGAVQFYIGSNYVTALRVFQSYDTLSLGYETTNDASFDTNIYGKTLNGFYKNTSGTILQGFILNQSGNVGIGTDNPSQKLHVNGTAKVTSLYIGNILITEDTTNGGLHINGAGLYADHYLSALGLNSDQTEIAFDEDEMWRLLGTDSTYQNIAASHLSNVTKTLTIKQGTNTWTYDGTAEKTVTLSGMSSLAQTAINSTSGSLSDFKHDTDLIYSAVGGGNTVADKPTDVTAFGVISMKTAVGYWGQILMGTDGGMYYRVGNTLNGGWKQVLTDSSLKSLTIKGGTTIAATYSPTSAKTLTIAAGDNISVTATDGTITIGNSYSYSLPTATADVIGGVKVGTTLAISNGVLNQKSGVATAGTYRSVTVDTYGRVTSGTNPNTLADYGIVATDALFASITAGTASKLSTVSKTLWGNTYWTSGGVPTSIGVDGTPASLSYVNSITMSGNVNMERDRYVSFKVGNAYYPALGVFGNYNVLNLGYETAVNGELATNIYGTSVSLFYGESRGLILNGDGNVGIGIYSPYTKLDVNGGVKASRFYLSKPNANNDTNAVYLTYDNNGGVHLVGAGFYADDFVSALGLNSDASASSFDEEAMWTALGPNGTGTIDNKHLSLSTLTINGTTYNPKSSTPTSITIQSVGDYLPLTGGTIVSANHQPLELSTSNSGADGWVGIQFKFGSSSPYTMYGGIRMSNADHNLYRYDQNFSTYKIWDTGNDSGLLTGLANNVSTNQIEITVGGTTKKLVVGYATSAGSATSATSAGKLTNSVNLWGNSFDGSADLTNSLTIANGQGINIKNSGGTAIQLVAFNNATTSEFLVGDSSGTYDTYLRGKNIYFKYGANVTGMTLDNSGDVTLANNLNMSQGKYLKVNINGTYREILGLWGGSYNLVQLGYNSAFSESYATNIYGHNLRLFGNASHSNPDVLIDTDGNVGIGTTSPSYKLHVSGEGYFTDCVGINTAPDEANDFQLKVLGNTFTSKLYLFKSSSKEVYLEYNSSNGGVHLVGAGLYADTYLSALGLNSNTSGGGGDTVNEPLSSINSTLSSNPSSSNKVIVWRNGSWTYDSYNSGGGGSGTVTSVGLSAVDNSHITVGGSTSPIQTSGSFTIGVASGYSIPSNTSQTNWDAAYTNKHTHSNKTTLDGITSTDVSNWRGLVNGTVSVGSANYASDADTLDGYDASDFAFSSSLSNYLPLTAGEQKKLTGILRIDSPFWTIFKLCTTVENAYPLMEFANNYNNTYTALGKIGMTPEHSIIKQYTSDGTTYTYKVLDEENYKSFASRNSWYSVTPKSSYDYICVATISMTGSGTSTAGFTAIFSTNTTVDNNSFIMHILVRRTSGNAIVYDYTITPLGTAAPPDAYVYSNSGKTAFYVILYGNKNANVPYLAMTPLYTNGTVTFANTGSSGSTTMTKASVVSGVFSVNSDGVITANKGIYTSSYISAGTSLFAKNSVQIKGTNYDYNLYCGGTGYFTGALKAASYSNISDMRMKDVEGNVALDIKDIAASPIITFHWKDRSIDDALHIGTSAQYWQARLPQVVSIGSDGILSQDYATTALAGVISVARKVVTHEDEIKSLKKRIGELEQEVELLKAA